MGCFASLFSGLHSSPQLALWVKRIHQQKWPRRKRQGHETIMEADA
jgi:hypothetical protein